MLQTMNLNDLLKKDDQLIREIKELDTSMQMLVYQNYNKFISATDTIRKMKVFFRCLGETILTYLHMKTPLSPFQFRQMLQVWNLKWKKWFIPWTLSHNEVKVLTLP
jgi:hypothetical protein